MNTESGADIKAAWHNGAKKIPGMTGDRKNLFFLNN